MSRENRVNPGTYTQAGRLRPDDAAREYAKQRQSSMAHDGRLNPKSHSEAWLQQAERAREVTVAPPPVVSTAWLERLSTGLGSLSVAVGAVGLLAGRRLARAPQLRDREATVRKTAIVVANAAAVCLSLYVAKRLASAAMSRGTSSAPATNHTPGRPYAYGI